MLEVILHDLTLEDTLYYLKGPYAEVVDAEAPYRGLFKRQDSAFHFTRSEDAFEAVNCYHHIHQSMAYLNDTLGFSILPFQYNGGVRYDPHGLNGADNSYYQPGNGRLSFGEGGVDDAEDVGVVVHELGHGIHDWVTYGGISQVNGLSEGLSDYWVTSYIRSLGFWEPEDPEYNWVFIWDGHNPFWPGRVTNDPGHYPEALVGQVHKDGQLWSSSLMQIWELIGREATDSDCWEGISMTGSSASQVDAALAFMQADMDLYDGEHLGDIAPVFVARGYIESMVTVDFSADQTGGEGPLTVQFQDESTALVGEISAWAWDFNGDGETDATGQDPEYTFSEAGAYSVTLTVTLGEGEYSETRENYIIVNNGFFVYEPVKGARDHSGVFIENFLDERGYETIYSNYFPSDLKGFDAVFISLGNYGSQITRVSDEMADIINAYLDEGGKIYLESGDAFGYDQFGNEAFFAHFGLESALDGEEKSVENLRGQTGTLFEGLYFNNSSQTAVDLIDRFTPVTSDQARAIFAETGYGDVGIAYTDDINGHQTICFSYALSELEDFSGHSSRYNALVLIMEYFGYSEGDAYVVANFSVSENNVEAGEEVTFTDWSATPLDYEVNSWKWDLDGDGNIDSEEQNPNWSYTKGGAYSITLIASNGIDTDTLTREDLVLVRSGILVYEEWEGENGFSGDFIRDYLLANGMDEVTYLNALPETLSGYDLVFASFGNSGHRKTNLTAETASTLLDFGYAGGQLYVEGGDVLSENENLWILFGLENVFAGGENIMTSLEGQQEALTAGLYFESSGQVGQMSIDRYVPFGGEEEIKVAFTESDYGNVAVQFDGSSMFGHKAFCFAYALADLQDGDGANTREELLRRILEFFGIFITGADTDIAESDQFFNVYPNPGNQHLHILFDASEGGQADLGVFDLSGRLVHGITRQASPGRNYISTEISDLQPGIYVVRAAACKLLLTE
ncbi:MAG: PKD domain-containing protein [bacterium]